jgi:hypothetical protein
LYLLGINLTDTILGTEDNQTFVYYKAPGSYMQIMTNPNQGATYTVQWFDVKTGQQYGHAFEWTFGQPGLSWADLSKLPNAPPNEWVVVMTCGATPE